MPDSQRQHSAHSESAGKRLSQAADTPQRECPAAQAAQAQLANTEQLPTSDSSGRWRGADTANARCSTREGARQRPVSSTVRARGGPAPRGARPPRLHSPQLRPRPRRAGPTRPGPSLRRAESPAAGEGPQPRPSGRSGGPAPGRGRRPDSATWRPPRGPALRPQPRAGPAPASARAPPLPPRRAGAGPPLCAIGQPRPARTIESLRRGRGPPSAAAAPGSGRGRLGDFRVARAGAGANDDDSFPSPGDT